MSFETPLAVVIVVGSCCFMFQVAKESICELKCYVLRNSAIVKPSSGAFFAKRQARQTLVLPHNLQKLIGPAVIF